METLTEIMTLLVSNEKFKNDFLNSHITEYASILGYVHNPNCKCKLKLIEFINNNSQNMEMFLNNWKKDNLKE